MGIFADLKMYRAYCKFKGRAKEALAMEDKAPLKSKTVWAGLIAAAIPLWVQVAKYLSLDPQLTQAVTALLTFLATSLGAVGVRSILGGIKKNTQASKDLTHPDLESG